MSAPSATVSSGRWLAISPASVCATMQASGAARMTEAISAALTSLKCSGRYILGSLR